jgi:hypothetical protein
VQEDAAVLGIPAEMVAETVTALETQTQQDSETVGVWASNAPALNRFLACATQWRAVAAGLGGLVWIGLDYAACVCALDGKGLAMTPADWSDLQVMEAAAISVMNGGAVSPGEDGDAA